MYLQRFVLIAGLALGAGSAEAQNEFKDCHNDAIGRLSCRGVVCEENPRGRLECNTGLQCVIDRVGGALRCNDGRTYSGSGTAIVGSPTREEGSPWPGGPARWGITTPSSRSEGPSPQTLTVQPQPEVAPPSYSSKTPSPTTGINVAPTQRDCQQDASGLIRCASGLICQHDKVSGVLRCNNGLSCTTDFNGMVRCNNGQFSNTDRGGLTRNSDGTSSVTDGAGLTRFSNGTSCITDGAGLTRCFPRR